MAYLPQSTFQKRQSYLLGGEAGTPGGTEFSMEGDTRPDPSTGGSLPQTSQYQGGVQVGGAAPITSRSNTQKATAQQSTQNVQPSAQGMGTALQKAEPLSKPDPISQPPSFKTSGTLQQRLFQPLQTGAERGQEALGEAVSYFQQEAGPSRTYGSIGAEDTLGRAVTGGAAGDIEAAQGLVGAQYGGPQGLEQGNVAALQSMLDQLRTRQQALGTGGGLQTLIQQSVAGLTPGEARFEAKRRLPGSREQARDIGFETIAPLTGQLQAERKAAEEFAKQRTGEEQGIAEQSRGFLTGKRGTIEQDLATKIAAAQQQQAQEAQEYQDILAADPSGRLAALRKVEPELAAGFDTDLRRQDIAADKQFQSILDDPKYASISEIDPLGMTITKRGKRFYSSDGQDLRSVVPDKKTRQLLYDRQQDLEDKFSDRKYNPFRRTGDPGELSALRPLYGEGGFDAADPADYLGFDPGMRPSRENLSSKDQKAHFNNIQDILGNLNKIGDAEPFRAAEIFADVDRYLEEENAALESAKENLSSQQKSWAKQVKTARKAVRKAKREETYGKIGAVVGGVLLGDPVLGQKVGAGAA